MDVITLAPLVVSAVLPLLKELGNKALNKVAEKSGEEIFNQRGAILETVKNVFLEDDLITLGLLADNPEDPKTQGKLEGKLEERLKSNPAAAEDLAAMIARLKEMSSEISNEEIEDSTVENEMKRGEGKAVISNKGIRGSKVTNKMN